MHFAVITLFPDMFLAITRFGVTARAVEKGLLNLSLINPRDFSDNAYQSIDDRPYGGGPGMVMMAPPLVGALYAAKSALTPEGKSTQSKVIAMSPQGKKVDQALLRGIVQAGQPLIFIAGRYEGIDERFLAKYVDEEWSIGDYVLTGGELPVMVCLDAMARWIPGVLGHEDSALEDSFVEDLLDAPHYTRPAIFEGEPVPPVLLSGNHAAIARWRQEQRLERTRKRRPDLLSSRDEAKED